MIIHGNTLKVAATSSGVASINIDSSLSGRSSSMAANFQFYRYKKIRFRIHPNALLGGAGPVTQGCRVVAGYVPEGDAATVTPEELVPNTVLALTSAFGAPGTVLGSVCTVPSTWADVPLSRLLGNTPTRWFQTSQDSQSYSTLQGQIQLRLASGAGTRTAAAEQMSFTVEVEYTVEFRGANV